MTGLGCGGVDPGPEPVSPVVLATSIPPHAWLIERIGGEHVTVHTVLRPGESPTTHQPSDAQVSRVLEARVYLRCGVPFESGPWFRALASELEVVDLRAGVPVRRMFHSHAADTAGPPSHDGDSVDPHIWLSPMRLGIQARTIAETLQRIDPDRAAEYAAALDGVLEDLGQLDAGITEVLTPYRGRTFVVFHPSWGYFADDYGLVQLAIEIEGKEPTDAELTRIQRRARDLGVTAVFVQPQISGRSAQAVADVLGARLETLDPLVPDVIANLRHAADAIAGGFAD
jgi:zinc transport system substrate-binding protein